MTVSATQKTDLINMITGVVKYHPIFNIFMSNLAIDWYAKLGKYIKRIGLDIQTEFGISTKCENSSLSIHFMVGILSANSLRLMFGEPLHHCEFGEGPSEDNPEFSPDYDYASYFVTISDCLSHIGYDHRGTTIECPKNINQKKLYESLCKIVDEFIKIK